MLHCRLVRIKIDEEDKHAALCPALHVSALNWNPHLLDLRNSELNHRSHQAFDITCIHIGGHIVQCIEPDIQDLHRILPDDLFISSFQDRSLTAGAAEFAVSVPAV